jgi:hypothetical protein
MFIPKDGDNVQLDEVINAILREMSDHDPYSKKYAKMVEQLTKLEELRKKNRISKDTWITLAAHLLGIAIVVGHERTNIISSKAVQFFTRLF